MHVCRVRLIDVYHESVPNHDSVLIDECVSGGSVESMHVRKGHGSEAPSSHASIRRTCSFHMRTVLRIGACLEGASNGCM